ncbi:TonB-dependent receptor [Loktanella sp. S4079]|uniref:TonB-dependent receptor n=1 Tax=Loktanella sp. S4079 TaxID=579483 RepID=UPI0005F9F674|nr:TonB-dependent receptor [Loktanella sp. S4079]KJZ19541.1 hypothetical protein TW80_01080 [Loktanella sp. S4079]
MSDRKKSTKLSLLLTSSALCLALGTARAEEAGFSIVLNGDTVAGDVIEVTDTRAAAIALRQADINVQYDGFYATPRLDAMTLPGGSYSAGSAVTFQSRTNYPAYISRGEIRIIDTGADAGPKTVAIVPINANGRVETVVPAGEQLVYVHRVYDAEGRYDETSPLSLTRGDARPVSASIEEGTDRTVVRNIRVTGGAVTISGQNVAPGASVLAMGEVIRPGVNSGFVIQRILPPGEYPIEVRVINPAHRNQIIEHDVTVPTSEWVGVGLVDLTFGRNEGDGVAAETGDYSRGRLAFYTKGRYANGTTVTASADTGDEDLKDIFTNLDQNDPRSLMGRMDSDLAYPIYGDGSTIVDDTPTSGKFYVRVERNETHALWGDFKSSITGTEYLRNERTLYGAQGVYRSDQVTANGDARVAGEVYAAQPDNLPQRDVFRGTGGSSYVLRQQDVSVGSETLTVEVRDPETGRVIDRRRLVFGADYDINYVQGIVLLNRPLTSRVSDGSLINANPNGDYDVNLIAQYEYSPTLEADGFSYGARAQAWVSDELRVGVSGMAEKTGAADQEAVGVDLRYQRSETTFVEAEYAETDGPGFGYTSSTDGGLTVDDTASVDGAGSALRVEGQVDLADVSETGEGVVSAYYEDRTAGFSTLDYQVDANETLWGVAAETAISEATRIKLSYDDYQNDAGKELRETELNVTHQLNAQTALTFGLAHQERVTPTSAAQTGSRTDAALRVDHQYSDTLAVYGYAQGTVGDTDGLEENNRIGVGGRVQLSDSFAVSGEISGGTSGAGARVLAEYDRDGNNTAYFGYTLDPDRNTSQTGFGQDYGSFVAGARRQVNERTKVFGETNYDLFGNRTALTNIYGVQYNPTSLLTYTATVETGRINDDTNGDFDRNAVSFGVVYKDADRLSARGRLEYRNERGVDGASNRDSDTWLIAADARHQIDEKQYLLAEFDALYTETSLTGLPDTEYVEGTLGYAYRPAQSDPLNVLASYTYLYDMAGQTVNGTAQEGPRQRAHIINVNANYDLNPEWTLGAKVGARWSEQADVGEDFVSNDAVLAALNVRYHVVHNWDILVEGRALHAEDIGTTEYSALGAVYRHVGENFKVGVGYNTGRFSDDLRDVTYDDKGVFINLVAKF